MLGRKFGRLTVISHKSREEGYNCLCECGKTTIAKAYMLKIGRHKSCGCLQSEHGQKNPRYRGLGELSKSHWCAIRGKAKQRKILFNLTIEEGWMLFLKQQKKCVYTGFPIQFGSSYSGVETTASLDRIDSTKGYYLENVQWVHKKINTMKWNFSHEEFVSLCLGVSKNLATQSIASA